jgi:16S rRNA (adenine1518-N6/adenine1519-N6)-dimethyltransferase
LSTRKSLGQHFLIDDGIVGRILKLADAQQGEHILEVGPGIGTLTLALLGTGVRVTAIETDSNLLPVLANLKAQHPQNFDYLHADAVEVLHTIHTATKLIANLPYAVAATIVLDAFCNLPALESATVMVQREVAERMSAKPGSKSYGSYTVKLQLRAQIESSFNVAPSNFLPPPRVDSTVIKMSKNHYHGLTDAQLDAAAFVANAAFAQRRKTIRNSMIAQFEAQGLPVALVDFLLESAGIDATVRGESLTVEQYAQLGGLLLACQACC